MPSTDYPSYPHKPIGSRESLLLALGITDTQLKKALADTDTLYKEKPQEKKDGSLRMTYDAQRPLKMIQKRIVSRILRKVKFPKYLHGGIRDKDFPRHPLSNARIHAGSYEYILLDIQDFYPSVRSQQVFDIWVNFFQFPPEVAKLLTQLTTKSGALPQGACTSGYLANLVFWDVEENLVEELDALGFVYSRFADDITISSPKEITNEIKTDAIARVFNMLYSKGVKPKRTKTQVRRKGQEIRITGFTTNGTTPALPKKERKKIRAAVSEFEQEVASYGLTGSTMSKYRSAMSRVGRLISANHPDGQKLKERLKKAAS